MVALSWFVHHTRFGSANQALASDRDAARPIGINVNCGYRIFSAD
jgi:branched-chain amino acid transport system permease protein